MKRNSVVLDLATKRFIVIKPPGKLPPVVLTKTDRKKVLDEFKEVFEREPTEKEIEELFIEELKLKQASNRG